ncbi:MAG: AAA family ATPase [Ferruginibacter sp.]
MSEKSISENDLSDEISKLKLLKKRKTILGKFLNNIIIQFSGADTDIAGILPDNDMNLLVRMGLFNIIFTVITLLGIGFIFFMAFDLWVALLFSLLFATIFIYCLKTSITAWLLHLRNVDKPLLLVKRWFISLCFIIALAGLAMWIFSNQIDRLAKQPYYEQEYDKYKTELSAINHSADTLNPNNSITTYLAGITQTNTLGEIDINLNQKKKELISLIPSYYSRINYDDSIKNNFSIRDANTNRYTDILPFSFPKKETGYTKAGKGLSGISFAVDSIGNLNILQNYYDSIFIASAEIDSINATQNILNFLLRNDKEKSLSYASSDSAFKYFYNSYIKSNILSSQSFLQIQSATNVWLQKKSRIDGYPILFVDKLLGFYLLLSNTSSGIVFIIIGLFFTGSILFQLVKDNLADLKNSKYPVFINLYENLEMSRVESIQEGLSDNSKTVNTSFSTKDTGRRRSRTNFEQLNKFGTLDYYMEIGQQLEEDGDYDGALEKYSKGYEKFPDEYEFLRMRADVFLKKNDVNQSLEYLKEYNKQKNNVTVENNLKRNIYIDYFEIKDHPFYGDLSWPVNKQMNILLGKNGYGKSHLFSILVALVQNDIEKTKEFSTISSTSSKVQLSDSTLPTDNLIVTLATDEKFPLLKEQKEILNDIADETSRQEQEDAFQEEFKNISFSSRGLNSLAGKVPILAISDTRFIDKSTNFLSRSSEHIDLRLDSAKHFLYQKLYSTVIENALYRVCQSYLEGSDTSGKTVIKLIENIFVELTGNYFTVKNIRSNVNTDYEILVNSESENELPIQKVSQGTFSVISIILIIYNYLRARYPGENDTEILNQQAIVFIDEVDAHLHPSWQQKIVNILRNTFPEVQFFITAHSPLVVAGSKKGEVSVLRKAQRGFDLEFFENDFIGYQPEELFRKVFEMESYDETYLKYNALIPFKEKFEKDIVELSSRERSKEDEKKLAKLYEDVYYMNVVAQRSEVINKERSNEN